MGLQIDFDINSVDKKFNLYFDSKKELFKFCKENNINHDSVVYLKVINDFCYDIAYQDLKIESAKKELLNLKNKRNKENKSESNKSKNKMI